MSTLNMPHDPTSIRLSRSATPLPALITSHSRAVKALEKALATYLRGNTVGASRPTVVLGGFRIKGVGVGGTRVDSVRHWVDEIVRL